MIIFLHLPGSNISSSCKDLSGLPRWLSGRESTCQAGDAGNTSLIRVWSLGRAGPLEKEMTLHSSILAWETLWTEEPGGLQSMGLQKSRMWLSNWACMHTNICQGPKCFFSWILVIHNDPDTHPSLMKLIVEWEKRENVLQLDKCCNELSTACWGPYTRVVYRVTWGR